MSAGWKVRKHGFAGEVGACPQQGGTAITSTLAGGFGPGFGVGDVLQVRLFVQIGVHNSSGGGPGCLRAHQGAVQRGFARAVRAASRWNQRGKVLWRGRRGLLGGGHHARSGSRDGFGLVLQHHFTHPLGQRAARLGCQQAGEGEGVHRAWGPPGWRCAPLQLRTAQWRCGLPARSGPCVPRSGPVWLAIRSGWPPSGAWAARPGGPAPPGGRELDGRKGSGGHGDPDWRILRQSGWGLQGARWAGADS